MTLSNGADGPLIPNHNVDHISPQLEHGKSGSLDLPAVYKEVNALREANGGRGQTDSPYGNRQDQANDQKLHQAGYLPHLHLDMDGKTGTQPHAPHNQDAHGHQHAGHHLEAHGHQHAGRHLDAHGHPHPAHHHDAHGRAHGEHPHGEHPHDAHGHLYPDHTRSPAADHGGAAHQGSTPGDARSPRTDQGIRPGDNGAAPTDQLPKSSEHAGTVPVPRVADSELTLSGPPTITPEKINQVLAQYHSPAQGMGQYVYDEGVKHGVNPAMALAFYVAESSAGTRGLAVKNNSWGNERGNGTHGYKPFESIEKSLDHWYQHIQKDYVNGGYHADKLGKVIPIYAPRSDGNDESNYIHSVGNMLRQWQS